jgi:hypothetical protein
MTYRFNVIYGNGVYVAGPRMDYTSGEVAVSKDGIAWTYHNVHKSPPATHLAQLR